MRYRKQLAAIFRRWASRLDPPVVDESPLAWVPTDDLAAEIQKRSDAAIIVYGWMRTHGAAPVFMSTSRIKATEAHVVVLRAAIRELGKEVGVNILGGRK